MALIKCPECSKDISDKAPACIHCGFPLSSLKNTTNIENKNEIIPQKEENNSSIKSDAYSLELIDYGDKKIQVAVALKNALNINDADALKLVANAPCYLVEKKSEHILAPLLKKLDSLPIEYKLYCNGKEKIHKLKSQITKLSQPTTKTNSTAYSQKINCPQCGVLIAETTRICPNCGFGGIASYLLELEREKRLKSKNYSHNVDTYSTQNITNNVPRCPTCQSTNIKKISGLSKAGSVAMWGIFSRKVHKQWHCNNCGSEW